MDIANIISSLGFPIAACCVMAYFVKYLLDQNRQQINELNERHNEEVDKLAETINRNTEAITKLCDKLGG